MWYFALPCTITSLIKSLDQYLLHKTYFNQTRPKSGFGLVLVALNYQHWTHVGKIFGQNVSNLSFANIEELLDDKSCSQN